MAVVHILLSTDTRSPPKWQTHPKVINSSCNSMFSLNLPAAEFVGSTCDKSSKENQDWVHVEQLALAPGQHGHSVGIGCSHDLNRCWSTLPKTIALLFVLLLFVRLRLPARSNHRGLELIKRVSVDTVSAGACATTLGAGSHLQLIAPGTWTTTVPLCATVTLPRGSVNGRRC
jgi:hypothetical protein